MRDAAQPPPGHRAAACPARALGPRGRAEDGDLLLPLVLQHAPRRALLTLDPGRSHATLRHRLRILPGPGAVLERRPSRPARPDEGHRSGRRRRGRELVVGPGLPGGQAAGCRDARGETAKPSRRGSARAIRRPKVCGCSGRQVSSALRRAPGSPGSIPTTSSSTTQRNSIASARRLARTGSSARRRSAPATTRRPRRATRT